MTRFSRWKLTSPLRTRISQSAGILCVGFALFALAGVWSLAWGAESHVAMPRATLHSVAAPVTHILNPHLHVTHAAATTTTSQPTAATVKEHRKHVHELIATHSHVWWHRSWSYHTFVAHHKGTGTVAGQVRGANGQPMRMARVVLKTPRGGTFKNVAKRHITHTNANGVFVMRGVRAGNYRVVAVMTKKRSHVETAVRTGSMSAVEIRI
jgi:hypothetical protein